MNYSEYTYTVMTDPSYWGDEVTKQEAEIAAGKLEVKLRQDFPGIEVRTSPMIGCGSGDGTTGPDDDVVWRIDHWVEANWIDCLGTN